MIRSSGSGTPITPEVFHAHRSRLFGVAYRVLGSVTDAEDVVQETWLATSTAATAVDDPTAYLTTAVGRRALNRLRDNARRRESYVGPWLPEPVSTEPRPDEAAELADSMTMAMLVMLDTMSPLERVAFVLCEVFEVPAPEAAETLGRSPAAVRQLVSRARRRVREHRQLPSRDRVAHLRVGEVFARAVAEGNLEALLAVLAPDVEFVGDGGGVVRTALRPVVGADHVARLLLGLVRLTPEATVEARELNGMPGFVVTALNGERTAVSFETDAQTITRLWVVRHPDKLHGLDLVR